MAKQYIAPVTQNDPNRIVSLNLLNLNTVLPDDDVRRDTILTVVKEDNPGRN